MILVHETNISECRTSFQVRLTLRFRTCLCYLETDNRLISGICLDLESKFSQLIIARNSFTLSLSQSWRNFRLRHCFYVMFLFLEKKITSSFPGIDVNRHKEIIVKAISGILLLLLKHFKVNHIYQFEFMSQHLVFANCIPLILKFFNQVSRISCPGVID